MKIVKKIMKSNGRFRIYVFGICVYRGRTAFLENVFGTDYDKNVLISYILDPFIMEMHKKHTNILECLTAAEIFRELKYNVDVVDYQSDYEIDASKYDVCYGSGKAFDNLLENKKILSIAYGTGCSFLYQNKVALKRLKEFYARTKVLAMSSIRYDEKDVYKTLYLSDAIIPLGNSFTAQTYRISGGCDNIKNLPCFYHNDYGVNVSDKDFSQARKNFLWFGSYGLLHKGLDILLELFKKRTDICLYVCGANEKERDFFQYYNEELSGKLDNIKNFGFVPLESQKFKDILTECAACVFPSVSEGGSPSLLTVMGNGGLIPIASQAAGVDISDYGFEFEEVNERSVEEKIDKFLSLSCDELEKLSERVQTETRQKYSYDNYKKNLSDIIKSCLTE